MILVFFKYLIITIMVVCAILIILLINSRLQIKIEEFNVTNISKKKNNSNLLVLISLRIWGICWAKFKINKEKLANIYIKEKIKSDNKKMKNNFVENILKIKTERKKFVKEIKKAKILLDELELNINIGFENVILTSYVVGAISIIISNVLPHIINLDNYNKTELKEKYKYSIRPYYQNENLYKVNLNCIFSAKLVHIIYVIYLIKRRVDNNERTSNRKSYEYSYE